MKRKTLLHKIATFIHAFTYGVVAVLVFSAPLPTLAEVRTDQPIYLRVIHFSDYAYREPTWEDTTKTQGDGLYHESYKTRTTITVMNPSNLDAKVRLQAFLQNGTLAYEIDRKASPGFSYQLLPNALHKNSILKPDWFVVSSNVPVMVDGHTIEEQYQNAFNNDAGKSSQSRRASQTILRVRRLSCDKPSGYEWLCNSPTRYTSWHNWLP